MTRKHAIALAQVSIASLATLWILMNQVSRDPQEPLRVALAAFSFTVFALLTGAVLYRVFRNR